MRYRVAYYLVAFVVSLILTHNTVLRVKGQPTVHGSENEVSSIGIVAEIQQLFEVTCQQQNEQIQQIHELHNASFQEMRRQLDASLQEGDRRTHNLNVSFKQMKNQLDSVVISLQEGDRRSQEQIRHMSTHNVSFQQMKNQLDSVVKSLQEGDRRTQNLNVSFQQMKNQLDSVVTSLQEGDRRTQNLNVSFQQMKNRLDSVVTSLQALEIDLEVLTFPPPTVNNWTILMNRFNGSLDFNRSWEEYRNGFGDIGRGEFWLGNEQIHRLTNRIGGAHTLRIELQLNATGQWYYADYDTFSIDSESNKYTLHLSGYSGNAGDSLTNTSVGSIYFLGGMNFSTFDNNNHRYVNPNCAMSYGGGWWFNRCHYACLTCSYNSAFRWYSLRHLSSDYYGRLRAARMMIKSK